MAEKKQNGGKSDEDEPGHGCVRTSNMQRTPPKKPPLTLSRHNEENLVEKEQQMTTSGPNTRSLSATSAASTSELLKKEKELLNEAKTQNSELSTEIEKLKRDLQVKEKMISVQQKCLNARVVDCPLEILLEKVKAMNTSPDDDPYESEVFKRFDKFTKKDLTWLVVKYLPAAISGVISTKKIDKLAKDLEKLSNKLTNNKSYAQATLCPPSGPNASFNLPPPVVKQFGSLDFCVGNKAKKLPPGFETTISEGLKELDVQTLSFKRHSDTRATVLFKPLASREKVMKYFCTTFPTTGIKLRTKEVKLLIHNVGKSSGEEEFKSVKQTLAIDKLNVSHCRWLKASNFENPRNGRIPTHSSMVLSLDTYLSNMELINEIRRSGRIVIGREIHSVSSYKDTPPPSMMPPAPRNDSNV